MNHNIIPDTPIVACTAYAMDNELKRCIDNGMNDAISKPV